MGIQNMKGTSKNHPSAALPLNSQSSRAYVYAPVVNLKVPGIWAIFKGVPKKIFGLLFFSVVFLMSHPVFAQSITSLEDREISKPILIIFVLFIMSLAPFVLMMTTSFIKISVVLSLLRSALGVQQIPPNPIITGLALILTIYVMIPVGQKAYNEVSDVIVETKTNQELFSMASVGKLKLAVDKGKEPVREFLLKHVHDQERKLFYNLGKKLRINDTIGELTDKDFIVLIPAFTVSELTEAFQIGFMIFLPFLVIDMVVSNILLSMGMFQLSPITVSLPFKLLLFVLVDGWYLITKGLVMGYVN
jgi:type III secretion protein R